MTTVLWFKRDLRLSDHPALACAIGLGQPVLPLYVLEPEFWAQPDMAARQWGFVSDCLTELGEDCRRHGAPLVLRTGHAVEVLADLYRTNPFTTLVSHEETGTGWSFARDKAVGAWASAAGVHWIELPQCGVQRRLGSRDHWAKGRDGFMRQPVLNPDHVRFSHSVEAGALPRGAALGLPPDPCPDRQPGGRSHALSTLGSFLTIRGKPYRTAMSSPLDGASACSRISPHLAWGSLSVREAVHATAARQAKARAARDGWGASLNSFQSRLAWRDHFIQKLEDAPDLDLNCLHPAAEALRARVPDAARLDAWTRGETGWPFLDACMRCLDRTGWLNFRMRAMVAAVGSYHLWLDWRSTGQVLARMFTDYEPGIHWSQMQMQSGTTGINTPRIYNPVKQGQDQDPTGAFTRRWLSELRDVPDAFLQTPWLWPGVQSLEGRYPRPIRDHAKAAAQARARIWALRKTPAFREDAGKVFDKHGSRKVSRRRPRKPRKDSAQLSLDL